MQCSCAPLEQYGTGSFRIRNADISRSERCSEGRELARIAPGSSTALRRVVAIGERSCVTAGSDGSLRRRKLIIPD